MKIFLTGTSGMLAAEIIPKLKADGHSLILTDARPTSPEISLLDITDHKKVREEISLAKPDYVFHLAAETNVDLCEQKPDHAFKVNTLGTENMALVCQNQNVPLLYISTGGNFSRGKKKPHTGYYVPPPLTMYL